MSGVYSLPPESPPPESLDDESLDAVSPLPDDESGSEESLVEESDVLSDDEKYCQAPKPAPPSTTAPMIHQSILPSYAAVASSRYCPDSKRM